MFGGVDGEGKHDPVNATQAFIRLCERAGVNTGFPKVSTKCAVARRGSPKGYTDGYSIMSDRVLKALWQATDGGRIPIVCECFLMYRRP